VVGSQLTGGVDLSGDNAAAGPYALNNGYSSATASMGAGDGLTPAIATLGWVLIASGTAGAQVGSGANPLTLANQATLDKLTQYDVDLSGSVVAVMETTGSTQFAQLNVQDLVAMQMLSSSSPSGITAATKLIRRCTRLASGSATQDPSNAAYKMTLVFGQRSSSVPCNDGTVQSIVGALTGAVESGDTIRLTFPIDDNLTNANALGAIIGTTEWGLEGVANIPEIDIKVDSVAVTAKTKKLKAKWTPELGQDLNAYHNLDAEVELTSILSEQIALEIDREILEDLVQGATAGTYYWARSPGLFVERTTGQEIGASSAAPDFTGTVSEWYETLAETINDVSAQIHRKTLRGGANFVVCGPEVANILEFTAGFRASVTADDDKGSIGSVKVGSLSKKFDVMVDPYFPRSLILVGRRGSSFLESGYVYAPYVPLQTTPTIFGPEDFVPRKGVMTRYAKKMVRPDMYGIVVVRGILGEAGATS
jgi:hypothetical protein